MTQDRFNEIVKEFLTKTEQVLMKKQDEYSLGKDRFAFFKNEAAIGRITPEQALYYCQLKHITSYIDMINSDKKFSRELWVEKLGDIVNYCILLYGLLEDQNKFEEKE